MFQAIRRWWGGGRGKVTARLFLFELAVVILGVLIAQGLAGFAQRRANLADMEVGRARVLYELETAHSMFQSWRAAIPCLNRRMTDVMNGKPLSSDELHRPSLPVPNYTPPEPFSLNLVAERYGVEEKNRLMNATDVITSLGTRVDLIINAWGRLMLLDPANGSILPADRAEARFAAADIKGQLRSLDIVTEAALETFSQLKVRARNNDEPDTGPPASCAAIWKSARLDPPRAVR